MNDSETRLAALEMAITTAADKMDIDAILKNAGRIYKFLIGAPAPLPVGRETEIAALHDALESVDFVNGVQRQGNIQLVRDMTFGQWKALRDAALSMDPGR